MPIRSVASLEKKTMLAISNPSPLQSCLSHRVCYSNQAASTRQRRPHTECPRRRERSTSFPSLLHPNTHPLSILFTLIIIATYQQHTHPSLPCAGLPAPRISHRDSQATTTVLRACIFLAQSESNGLEEQHRASATTTASLSLLYCPSDSDQKK